jgi:hypothetical protein
MRMAIRRVRTKGKEWGNLRVLANGNELWAGGLEGGFFYSQRKQMEDLKFQTRGYDILWRSCLCDVLELMW